MKLIICEKPNLAQNCVRALMQMGEHMQRNDGYYEGKEYIVTFALGHLLGLYELEDYIEDESQKGWKRDNLPFVPEHFQYKFINTDTKRQYGIVKKLILRDDVDLLINFGDADREGECIVRNIVYRALGNRKKEMKRLWTDAQTEEDIKNSLRNLRSESEFDALYNEGIARTNLDWLLGINLTRYLTLITGGYPLESNPRMNLIRTGRVLLPIVKKVYDTDMSIRNFEPQTYYQAEAECEIGGIRFRLEVKNPAEARMSREKVEQIVRQLNSGQTIVKSVEQKDKKLKPPKLFDLGHAQSAIAKKHRINLDLSMKVIQSLYIGGYLSYPRTDVEYLADTEKPVAKQIIQNLSGLGYEVAFKDSKSIFDNSKVIGHSALIPTHKILTEFEDELQEKVYKTILNRFCAVFCSEECVISETVATIQNGEYVFRIKGQATKQKGFLKYDNTKKQDNEIPNLKEGDVLQTDFRVEEKKTAPPGKLTVEALDNYMRNPFKKEQGKTDDEDYKAILEGASIGTKATRTPIINNAIHDEYISLKNNTYSIMPRGEFLIDLCELLDINLFAERTAEFGRILRKINQGQMTPEDCIQTVSDELQKCIDFTKEDQISDLIKAIPKSKTVDIGLCPICNKGNMQHGKFGFYCTEKCGFSFNKFMGTTVTDTMMKAFVEKKRVLVKGLVSKEGKKYDAYILPKGFKEVEYEKDGETRKTYNLEFDMEFPKSKKKRKGGK